MAESVLTDDGIRLWAHADGPDDGRGDAAAVVLCHGGPGLWDMAEPIAAMLCGERTVIRWDQRGAGRSDPVGPYSLARSVADLEAVRRHFGLESMTLLGHSWGAQLALAYTLGHPHHVERLLYVSGTGIDPVDSWQRVHAERRTRLLGRHADRWHELRSRGRTPLEDREYAILQWSIDFADHEHGLRLAEQLATPWYGVNDACVAAIKDECLLTWGTPALHTACRTLTGVPVLILDGALDPRPRSAVDSLEQALPDVARMVLNDVAHWPWLEDPAGFAAACRVFLGLGGGGGGGGVGRGSGDGVDASQGSDTVMTG